MNAKRKLGLLGAAGIGLATMAALLPAGASAGSDNPFAGGNVPTANSRTGVEDNVLAPGLRESSVAAGRLPLFGADSATGVTHYGYNTSNTGGRALTQDPAESFKTEPDKNVYLVFGDHHYLYQGHETGPRGYVTRIDLDQPDLAQRVTLLAELPGATPPNLPTFDGITWDPWTHQLLVTSEAAAPNGGVYAVSLDGNGDAPTHTLVRLPALGSGGYEGIQNDSSGNVWIVEDIGGAAAGKLVDGKPRGKVPNSYVYRFRPENPNDLSTGTLEALQVLRRDGSPVTAGQLQANPVDQFITDLHTYGSSFQTRWVSLGANPADSTAAAKAKGATPFKRPENGVFRPGTGFGEFYFTETGDTDNRSDLPGAFGAVFKLSQQGPSADGGTISPALIGDVQHTGFDNIQFATRDQLLVVEDAGDTLHGQRNALDSGYVFTVSGDRTSRSGPQVTRWLAEGRDASATYDALFSPGYNDGDNEITGIHVSDGDPGIGGVLGAKLPQPFTNGWRGFWTQQHGDNITWELRREGGSPRGGDEQGQSGNR